MRLGNGLFPKRGHRLLAFDRVDLWRDKSATGLYHAQTKKEGTHAQEEETSSLYVETVRDYAWAMEWYADDEFWSTFHDWMFPAQSFVEAAREVDQLVKLLGIDSGAVLDLCCGPGRHSVPLAKKGFQVTGVDLQPSLIAKAREYAYREGVGVDFVKADMLEFRRPRAFDLAISMFSSFGYFSEPEHDLQVLGNVSTSLRGAGVLVLDLRGKETHAMDNAETYSEEMPGGDLVFQRTTTNDDWTRANSIWVHVSGERARTFRLTYNLYSGAELRELLRKAGFAQVRLYGGLQGCPYNQRAKRLVAVASKGAGKESPGDLS